MITPTLAAVEAGGTKFICALADAQSNILCQTEIPTAHPDQTLRQAAQFFLTAAQHHGAPAALGIACFGPLQLDPAAPNYGCITTTPKPHWSGVNPGAILAAALGCPVITDTDVNAAGLAEAAAADVPTLAYVTVGTGIGAGLIQHGRALQGLSHPEMGHFRPRRHALDAQFPGICPYHGDCLEGLASGAAIVRRTGRTLAELPPDDPLRAIVADYLAQYCATLTFFVAPHRIVLGGGVMAHNPDLLPKIRLRLGELLADYVAAPDITAPQLSTQSGILGALMLAGKHVLF